MEKVQLGVPKITAFCKRLADRGVALKTANQDRGV